MPINYGTIGSGWITDSWITAATRSSKWKLHSIYSRRDEQAKAFGSKHNCSNTYTSLSDFAADKDLQAVYIASPNSHHYEHAKQILRAKKHVVLEKPATSTVAELEELFRIAKEEGVMLIEAFRHIQEANFKILQKALTEEKRLGQIYGASFTYASYSSRYTNVLNGEKPNIFSLEFSGGSLVDVGVYPVCCCGVVREAAESGVCTFHM
jgi:predicted dehydrogenase